MLVNPQSVILPETHKWIWKNCFGTHCSTVKALWNYCFKSRPMLSLLSSHPRSLLLLFSVVLSVKISKRLFFILCPSSAVINTCHEFVKRHFWCFFELWIGSLIDRSRLWELICNCNSLCIFRVYISEMLRSSYIYVLYIYQQFYLIYFYIRIFNTSCQTPEDCWSSYSYSSQARNEVF